MSAQDPENQYPFVEKRQNDHEKRLSLLEQAFLSLKSTNEGLTTKMDLILAQLTKVALLEERHVTQQADVNRAHERVSVLENAFKTHQSETDKFIAFTKGQSKILWAIGISVLALMVKALFFAASHGMTP